MFKKSLWLKLITELIIYRDKNVEIITFLQNGVILYGIPGAAGLVVRLVDGVLFYS